MIKRPKKAAVLGFDCAQPHLILKHIEEGVMPNFKKILDRGTFATNCMAPFPTITPPNWACIATGASVGTHNVTDFWVPIPGTTRNTQNTVQAFSSERVKAECVWDALDRIGKRCMLLNYPGSWPSKMRNGIVIGGRGVVVGDHRDGFWLFEYQDRLGIDKVISTKDYILGIKSAFREARGWSGGLNEAAQPLELEANLNFVRAMIKPLPMTWHVLAEKTGDAGYDQITLCRSKDLRDTLCTLKVGQWSDKIRTTIKLENGLEVEVSFRCKLIELSRDAKDFRLYLTAFTPLSEIYYREFSAPPEALQEIENSASDDALIATTSGVLGKALGWFDWDTYLEVSHMNDNWMAEAAGYLLKDGDWDLFYMHSHAIDFTYHININGLDPNLAKTKEEYDLAWEVHRKIHQSQDELLGRILDLIDDDTLVFVVSDHGATPDGPMFNPYEPLINAGLTVLKEEGKGLGKDFGRFGEMWDWYSWDPDPKKSVAMPQNCSYIYINLKGRDPEGIVEPSDYEKVQQQIIDALYTYVDPVTGKRPVALALTKKDARLLGLHGDMVGDVVYATYPWFGNQQHGPHLSTAEYGIGKVQPLLMISGPGIKKGFRLERTVWLTDVVPTMCYLMDWPLPRDVEGAVIYQAFEDMNFKSNP